MKKYKSTIIQIAVITLLLTGMYLIGQRMQGIGEGAKQMDEEAERYFDSIDKNR